MPYKPKIVTRGLSTSTVSTDSIPKNAALSNNDMDSNLLNLRDASIGIAADDSTVIDIGMGNTLRVIGAGGVTTAVSGQSITIDGSGISGGGTNSFSTIAVAGQSSVVADSTTDTLTLAAGSGITLTTNAGTDTITIAATASLGDLSISGSTISTTNAPITINPNSTSASGNTGNINMGYNTVANIPDIVFRDIINYDSDYHGNIGPSDYIGTGGIINAITCAGDLMIGAGYTNQAGTEDAYNSIVLDARITRLYGSSTKAILSTSQDKDLVLSCFATSDTGVDSYLYLSKQPIITLHGQPHTSTGRYGDIELKPAREQNSGSALNPDGAVILDDLYVRQTTISAESTNQDIKLQCNGTGTIDMVVPTSTTIGANGAASALTANPVGYLKIKINGTTYQLPYYNV